MSSRAKKSSTATAKAAAAAVVEEVPEVNDDSEEEEDDEEEEEEDEQDNDDDDDDEEEDDEEEDDEEEEEEEEEDEEEEEEDVPRNKEDVVDDLVYDVFNLAACNYHPLRFEGGAKNKEQVLNSSTHRAATLLLQKLAECPVEQSDIGPLVVLPTKEIFRLPRAYKLPEKKPETKWEAFAKLKGIKKKKRERMVFDEVKEEFMPRFGYKRANNGIEDYPIVEVKSGGDIYADPWAEARKEKQDRVKRNEKRQQQNVRRANFGKKGGGLSSSASAGQSYDSASVPGIPVDMNKNPIKRGKGGVKTALQLAQISTASMGRFDAKRAGEPEIKLRGKKRSFKDNLTNIDSDKKNMKDQIRFVVDKADKKARGVTNSLAAYEGILPDAPTDSFKQKKGKGKNMSSASAGQRKKSSGRKLAGGKGKAGGGKRK